MNLTFAELKTASLERLKHFKNARGEAAHSEPDGSDWSIADWLTATIGELGEFANIIKKTRRADFSLNDAKQDLADELADVQCYLMLLSERCGIDLEQAVIDKFNAVSKRIGSSVTLKIENGRTFEPPASATDEQVNWDNVDSNNAEIAYNAYAKAANWLTYDNKPMPVWNGTELPTLPDNIKHRWFEAARAIREASDLPF